MADCSEALIRAWVRWLSEASGRNFVLVARHRDLLVGWSIFDLIEASPTGERHLAIGSLASVRRVLRDQTTRFNFGGVW